MYEVKCLFNSLLHLDDELLALLVLAIDIEDGLAVDVARAKMFAVEIRDVPDDFMTVEKRIEEADEQVFVHLRAEQLLETEVGVGIDIAFLSMHSRRSYGQVIAKSGFCLPQRYRL